MDIFSRQHRLVSSGCLFVLFLLYFVFGTGWYEPGRLVIKGRAAGTDAVVDVQWDSGAGYNGYEREQFQFLAARGGEKQSHLLILDRADGNTRAGGNNRVVLYEIRSDDRGVPIPQTALRGVGKTRGTGWFLGSDESEIRLWVPAKERLFFLLQSDDRSGVVRVTIDGQEIRHDLYQGNWEIRLARLNLWFLDHDGNFTVSFDMPRYRVESLRVTVPDQAAVSFLTLQTKTRSIDLPFRVQENGVILVHGPNRDLKHFFHPVQFSFQLLFAFFLTWLVMAVGRKAAGYGSVHTLFLANGRWLFWVFFSGAAVVYSLWLLAFWPGVMSVDSLNIWRAAWLPDVMINNHPLLNVVWYMFLLQLWDNIAVVPISQIVLLSFLLSSVLFFCFRQGIRLRWLVPCFFLVVLSIPIGLYTVTLWKDVPFALLVLFWSLVPVFFFYRKKKGQSVKLSIGQGMLLFLSFLALLLFRHNGLLYLIVMPLLFISIKVVRIPPYLMFSGIVIGIGLFFLVVFPPQSLKGGSYFHDLSSIYIHKFAQDPMQRVSNTVREFPRLLDLKKNKGDSDLWHYFLGDRYAYTFLRDVGWNDTFPYIAPEKYVLPALHNFALSLYKQSLEYPWIYFTWNPFWLLYLFPLSILLARWFPLSAVFSVVVLSQIAALLVFVGTVNWRYYYFVLVGGYFLLPVALLDWHYRISKIK